MRALLGFAALALAACGGEDLMTWKTVEISPFLGDQVMGDPAAPVEIVEYASTTCGHCAAFHQREMPQLKERYIDTGKAKLRWIVMPTPPSEISLAGAALARCAGEAKFFEVIDDLFKSQDALIKAGPHPRRLQDALVALGGRHGLNADEVGTCIGDARIQQATVKGVRGAPDSVTGTPTFFVDGKKVEEHSTAAIGAAIDAILAAKQAN